MEIIPAMDLIDGKCVRLAQGDFSRKKVYRENPLEMAQEFEAANLKRLHIVDLDGAKNGKLTGNVKQLEIIARQTNLIIDFGGGINTDEAVETVFNAGAAMASIGSLAVKEAEKFARWLEKYGGDKILLGADARSEKIAVDGWQTETKIEVIGFLKNNFANGATQAFVTDISKDGLLEGTAKDLYAKIKREIPSLKLIASGGVSEIEDIAELERIGCAGVIVGKAIYEGRIKLEELQKFLQ